MLWHAPLSNLGLYPSTAQHSPEAGVVLKRHHGIGCATDVQQCRNDGHRPKDCSQALIKRSIVLHLRLRSRRLRLQGRLRPQRLLQQWLLVLLLLHALLRLLLLLLVLTVLMLLLLLCMGVVPAPCLAFSLC